MKNITVSVDEETYRLSRVRAAELETSVSALVRGFLRSLVGDPARGVRAETQLERRRRLLREVTAEFEAQGVGLRPADNLSREELYDRDLARAEAAEAAKKGRGGTSV
jgi:plasmid stability protein